MATPIPNPQSMRVLIRPPIPPPPSSTPPLTPHLPTPPLPPPDPPPPSHSSPLKNGVVVVGFIGGRHDDVASLINRIIDCNVFGSGNLDRSFTIDKQEIVEEVKSWFECRKISYFHDEENGILYLQLSSTHCPITEGLTESKMGFDSALEDREFGDLQGMLVMFSVCHVVIFIQEGSRFDTQILKKFRVLQAAKNAMAPFVKSGIMPMPTTVSHTSSSGASTPGGLSNNPSPIRSRGMLNRNTSAIKLMSGLGSYTSLLPGQCTPVILFVFLDDCSEVNENSSVEEQLEHSSSQSSSLNSFNKSNLPAKGSGSVVVLARPSSKSGGGFRKKLQSSLEGQIRFSIKKCRVLSSAEPSHTGPRSGGISALAPLFSLDASKAVALLDISSNQKIESIEFATSLVEDVLTGKATPDCLLLESHGQSGNKEDLLSVKEFIFRQSDILRGRGGTVSNTNSGSAAGVGMVAVAAAAAAASVAPGKTFIAPELPSLEIWLSSSQLIFDGVISAKHGCIDETEINRRKLRQRGAVSSPVEGNSSKPADPLEVAVSYLASCRGLNTKFSTLWCQKSLPVAKEVYLNELPPCYPTSQHKAHLEKALAAFNSMVKGPAVKIYIKKLEDECTSIWSSGRQLCDAVSLTGKPCMHQRHDEEGEEAGDPCSGDKFKPHSSGYVFFHACACGRSRQLRPDPFDFDAANVTCKFSADCDKNLPALQLPQGSIRGPIQASSWILIRVGNARYYHPSRGLLQSGFSSTEKFLLKWTIVLEKQYGMNGLSKDDSEQVSLNGISSSARDEPIKNEVVKNADVTQLHTGDMRSGAVLKTPLSRNRKADDENLSLGRGHPNLTMRKAFSEVVAGSGATDLGFPPLRSRNTSAAGTQRSIKADIARDRSENNPKEIAQSRVFEKIADAHAVDKAVNQDVIDANGFTDGNGFLPVGSKEVSVNRNSAKRIKDARSKLVATYVGFEHECPHGHRFLLTPELLNGLGSPYQDLEESHVGSSVEDSEPLAGNPSKFGKNGGPAKARQLSNNKVRISEKSKVPVSNNYARLDGAVKVCRSSKEGTSTSRLSCPVKDLEGCGSDFSAFSLLNRNLPIYMNCPHCMGSNNTKEQKDIKFAGTISQLQRIFLVTPPFPVVLATCPVVQFEASCAPSSIDHESRLQFSLGCPVILPPESFLSLRLPFVYGVQLQDGNVHPLMPLEHQPQLTAWINKGTTLQVISKGSQLEEGSN